MQMPEETLDEIKINLVFRDFLEKHNHEFNFPKHEN